MTVSGDNIKKLEEKGIVIRFVIGRRFFLRLNSFISLRTSTLHEVDIVNSFAFPDTFLGCIHLMCYRIAVQIEVIAWIATLMRKTAKLKIS